MTRREVAIGLIHGFRIEDWPDLFDSPECKVTKENGGYWLTACRFENLDDRQVLESAKKLKTMMAAFAKIELGTDFRSIERDYNEDLGDIRERVGDKTTMSRRGTAKAAEGIWSAGIMTGVLGDKDGDAEDSNEVVQQARQERWYDYLLNRCDEEINRDVLDALFYYAENTSWYSLWKVFETITLDINSDSEPKAKRQIDKYGWAEEDKLNAFGYWAQYYDAVNKHSGRGSRHSRALYKTEEYKPKHKLKRKLKRVKKPSVMELHEAEQLIGHLSRKWVESKRPETMTFYCFSFLGSSECMKMVEEYLNHSK
jgi:hypothetical protein